ncbi:MAG: hypothetical protein HFJ06_16530 [Lachnospiraceae bacterium]|nr:hypothetical protein [Lachnospiraceae bacterium]
MMENNYNLKNKRIFVDGCIDESCCIPLSPRDFNILGFDIKDELLIRVTEEGIVVTKRMPSESEQAEIEAVLFNDYITLDLDVCRSKGLLESKRMMIPYDYEIVHYDERHYRLCYFVEKGKLTIPLTLQQISAPMHYIRPVFENGYTSVPSVMCKTLKLEETVGYLVKDDMLCLSNNFDNKIAIDSWYRIQLPDDFERLYPKDIEEMEFILEDEQIICKFVQ